MRVKMVASQSLLILLLSFSPIHCEDTKEECHSKDSDAIDDFIEDLNYNRDEVLAFTGDSKTRMVPNEGTLDENGNFIVITRTKKNLENENVNIGVVASNEHQTYPGALLLANQRLMDNQPDVLAVARAPITYTIDLPGMTADGWFTIIPSFSEFLSSVDQALEIWFDKYPKDNDVAADFESEESFAFSKEELIVKFGFEFKNSLVESSIDFDAVKKQQKLVMIHRFKQIFYTVSVQPTENPSDLFGCDLSLEELKKKVNEENPPVIVDSVSYGRTVYVKLETSSTDDESKGLLENSVSTYVKNKNKIDSETKLKDLTMQVFVIGGGSNSIDLINAKSLEEVNSIIVQNGNFSRTNLGYPVSYSAQFIKDNSRAVVNMATEYIETTRTVHKKGIIKIIHHGLYVTEWNVTWENFSYDKKGNKVEKRMSWERNGKVLTAPFEEEIELPGNTENIHVICKYVTGLPWRWMGTLIDRNGIDLIDRRVFKVSGTTLFPTHTIDPDPDEADDDPL